MTRNEWLVPTVVGVLGLTGGGTLGYLIGRRRGAQKMSEQVMEMLTELRSEYNPPPDGFKVDRKTLRPQPVWVNKTTDFGKDDDEVVDGSVEEVSLPSQGVVIRNVFTIEDDTWDYEEERSTREGKSFYVIHHDEYMGNEMDYHQATITYYAGDDILADEADTPMYNFREQMGDTFEFGKGSGDPNVVYVRNERESAEFEILLHLGRFEVEVLGLEIEEALSKDDLKHSVPRFRLE